LPFPLLKSGVGGVGDLPAGGNNGLRVVCGFERGPEAVAEGDSAGGNSSDEEGPDSKLELGCEAGKGMEGL
jgi:hypothetical protein